MTQEATALTKYHINTMSNNFYSRESRANIQRKSARDLSHTVQVVQESGTKGGGNWKEHKICWKWARIVFCECVSLQDFNLQRWDSTLPFTNGTTKGTVVWSLRGDPLEPGPGHLAQKYSSPGRDRVRLWEIWESRQRLGAWVGHRSSDFLTCRGVRNQQELFLYWNVHLFFVWIFGVTSWTVRFCKISEPEQANVRF